MIEEDLTFSSGALALGATLSRPGVNPAPGVVLISGSGHNDRDETVCGHKPFKVIANFLVRHGYAVLRYDDRGVGASEGSAERKTFEDSVADAAAAVRFLRRDPRIAALPVTLIGHSEGGLVAAAVAAATNCPVLMLAAPCTPMEQQLHRQAEMISIEAGATEEQVQHERQMNIAVFGAVRAAQTTAEAEAAATSIIRRHLKAWPGVEWSSEGQLNETAATMASIVSAPDYRSLLQQDPAKLLGALSTPIAAVFGSLDQQVDAAPNRQAFHTATVENPAAWAIILPGHNHLLQVAETGSIREYQTLGQSPSDYALRAIAACLAALDQHDSVGS